MINIRLTSAVTTCYYCGYEKDHERKQTGKSEAAVWHQQVREWSCWKKIDSISPLYVCRNVPSLAWPTSLPSSTTRPLILTHSHPKSDGKRHS